LPASADPLDPDEPDELDEPDEPDELDELELVLLGASSSLLHATTIAAPPSTTVNRATKLF